MDLTDLTDYIIQQRAHARMLVEQQRQLTTDLRRLGHQLKNTNARIEAGLALVRALEAPMEAPRAANPGSEPSMPPT